VGATLSRFSIAADDKTANVRSKIDKIVERMSTECDRLGTAGKPSFPFVVCMINLPRKVRSGKLVIFADVASSIAAYKRKDAVECVASEGQK
jgi:hypothetical protein